METSGRSAAPQRPLAPQVFLSDARLVLAVLNHLRYQALNRVFGTSREQANVLTVVLLLGAADSAYEAARRISGMRLRASDAGLGTIALREAALGVAGPSARKVPGFGALRGGARSLAATRPSRASAGSSLWAAPQTRWAHGHGHLSLARPQSSAPVAPVVATVRAPIVTMLYNSRRADDRGGSRDRSAAEYSRPASTSWA
jgi:hypothetical protein